jgi:hypothetical protein
MLCWLDDIAASWHCLGIPVSHCGEVNWRGFVQKGDAIRKAPINPGGSPIVLTSAGFRSRELAMLPRINRLVAGVAGVLDAYGTQSSNLRRAAFRSGFNGLNRFTVSLCHSDEGMPKAAYQPGTHYNRMDEDKAGLLSDRTSFTRLRVIRSWDDWNGKVVRRNS